MLNDLHTAALEKALEGVAARQEAIQNNIANIETPNYQPQRVSFEQALRAAIKEERSDRDGAGSGQAIADVKPRVLRQPVAPGAPLKLDMETELTELAKTSLQHEALVRTLTKQFRMLRTAITGGSQA